MIDPFADAVTPHGQTLAPAEGEGAVYPITWRGCTAVYQAIARTLTDDLTSQRNQYQTLMRRSIIYQPCRRELAYRRLGLPQLFFPRQVSDRQHEQKNVHLYLDVSGSMTDNSVLHFLYGLLIYLHGQITPPFFHFTTAVRSVTLEQIQRGVLVTGGTDIDCVITHALQNDFSRILVISDGDFGEIEANLLSDAHLQRLMAAFLLTTDTTLPTSAATLGPSWPIHEELAGLQHQQIQAAHHNGPKGKGTRGSNSISHNPVPWFTVNGC